MEKSSRMHMPNIILLFHTFHLPQGPPVRRSQTIQHSKLQVITCSAQKRLFWAVEMIYSPPTSTVPFQFQKKKKIILHGNSTPPPPHFPPTKGATRTPNLFFNENRAFRDLQRGLLLGFLSLRGDHRGPFQA